MATSAAAAALLAGLLLGPSTPTTSHHQELPSVRVIPATFREPTLGHRLGFTEVRLSAPSDRRVVVEISTRSGTAKAGRDFVPLHPTIVFAPGETTATVSVEMLADDRNEPKETLRLVITEVRRAVAVGGGRITILDAPGG